MGRSGHEAPAVVRPARPYVTREITRARPADASRRATQDRHDLVRAAPHDPRDHRPSAPTCRSRRRCAHTSISERDVRHGGRGGGRRQRHAVARRSSRRASSSRWDDGHHCHCGHAGAPGECGAPHDEDRRRGGTRSATPASTASPRPGPVWSSVRDMARWLKMLLDGGTLPPAARERRRKPHPQREGDRRAVRAADHGGAPTPSIPPRG